MIDPSGVALKLDSGGEWRLRMTWRAILRLHDAWGDEYEQRAAEALRAGRVADLAIIIEAAGGPDVESVLDESPPLEAVQRAIQDCWNWMHLGIGAAQRLRAEADAMRARMEADAELQARRDGAKKKTGNRFLRALESIFERRQAQA